MEGSWEGLGVGRGWERTNDLLDTEVGELVQARLSANELDGWDWSVDEIKNVQSEFDRMTFFGGLRPAKTMASFEEY